MILRLSVWLFVLLLAALMVNPASALTLLSVEEGPVHITRENRPPVQAIIIDSTETNLAISTISYGKTRDPRLSHNLYYTIETGAPAQERMMPSNQVEPPGMPRMPPNLEPDSERNVMVYNMDHRDPYLALRISILRLKASLNPTMYPALNVYKVNTISDEPDVVENPNWQVLGGGEIDYSTLAIPSGKDRIWVDLLYESGPLLLTIYSPDAEIGPFEDTDDGIADNRIYLEITGDTTIPNGEWYFRIENTGEEETRYTFTIWY